MSILLAVLMSFLSIIVPEEKTNIVLNPIAGTTGNVSARVSATVTFETDQARFGIQSVKVVLTGSNDGAHFIIATAANAIHHISFYVHGTPPNTLQAALNGPGSTFRNATAINSGSNGWVRYQVTAPASESNGATTLFIRQNGAGAGTIYIDGVQVEQSSNYWTTLISGDQEGSFPGVFRWSGLKHASTSTRSAQERNGGRERDLSDAYGVELVKNNYNGIGVPPVTLNMQPLALQAGAVHQSTKLSIRNANYQLDIEGTSYQNLHQKRQDLIDVVGPHAVRGDQAFTMGFSGANSARIAYGRYRYNGGLGFTQPTTFTEQVFLSMIAVDSDFSEDDRQTQALDFQDTDTDADYVMARIDGAWTALGTGMSGAVRAIAIDKERGRVYFGGSFATADGVTVNNITYWDGVTFVAMGGATKGVDNTVQGIAIASNGDVWVGGAFANAGGAASDNVAKFDISAGTWTVFGAGPGTGQVNAIAIDSIGIVYLAGSFTNWDADANADGVVSTTDGGSTWTALSTGLSSSASAIAIDQADNVFIGGGFATAGGVTVNFITKWDGSAFAALGSGMNNGVLGLAIAKDGGVYAAGQFTTAGGVTANRSALWSGSTWSALGTGLNGDSIDIAVSPTDGSVHFGGSFTTAGGISLGDRYAVWNGSTWIFTDIDMPGSPTVRGIAINELGDIYLGYSTAGTATIAGSTIVTNGGTAKTSPTVTIIGPTTVDVTATLQWIENQSTGARLYFNMPINTGEIITIDTRAGRVGIFSNFRGEITDNPLPPGGLSLFDLLPGANTIAAFMTGTTTGAEVIMHWDVKHLSVDGVA